MNEMQIVWLRGKTIFHQNNSENRLTQTEISGITLLEYTYTELAYNIFFNFRRILDLK